MAEAALLLVVLLAGVAVPLALYALVRAETSDRRELSRTDAEAYARERAQERYDGSGDRDREHE
jgi:uncharacterized membrane protein YozB (DUF420 family)